MRKIQFIHNGKRISHIELFKLVHGTHDFFIPTDITNCIFSYVTCGKTFKEILHLNSYYHNTQKHKTDSYVNILWTLIDKHPNAKWNWYRIMENPNTTLKIIKERRLLEGKENKENWWPVFHNPNITMDFLGKNCRKKKWICNYVTDGTFRRAYSSPYSNPAFPIETISAHMQNAKKNDEKRFIMQGAVQNPNLTPDFIEKHINMISGRIEYEVDIIRNKYLYFGCLRDIYEKLNVPLRPHFIYMMASSPNVELEFILSFKDNFQYLSLSLLSYSPRITLQDIINNITLPWDWPRVSANPNITMDIVEQHINNPLIRWCPGGLSYNPNLTIDFVRKYFDPSPLLNEKHDYGMLDEKWSWYLISSNIGISMADIENNPDLPWNLDGILKNPNLDLRTINKYNIEDICGKIPDHKFGL